LSILNPPIFWASKTSYVTRDPTNVSLTATPAPEGYPISGFTWIALYREQHYNKRTREQAGELVRLLWWMTHEGQKYAAPLYYAPLPRTVARKAEKIVASITFDSTAVMIPAVRVSPSGPRTATGHRPVSR